MKDKSERFKTLAEKRVARALHDLRLVGNLANKHNYSYTKDQAHRIITALEQELKLLKARSRPAFPKDNRRSNSKGNRPRSARVSRPRRDCRPKVSLTIARRDRLQASNRPDTRRFLSFEQYLRRVAAEGNGDLRTNKPPSASEREIRRRGWT